MNKASNLIFGLIFSLLVGSCGEPAVVNEPQVKKEIPEFVDEEIEVQLVIKGEVESLTMFYHIKGDKSSSSVEKEIELKKNGGVWKTNVIVNTGSFLNFGAKTRDSYGPEVTIKVLKDGVECISNSDSYIPNINGMVSAFCSN